MKHLFLKKNRDSSNYFDLRNKMILKKLLKYKNIFSNEIPLNLKTPAL